MLASRGAGAIVSSMNTKQQVAEVAGNHAAVAALASVRKAGLDLTPKQLSAIAIVISHQVEACLEAGDRRQQKAA